MRILPHLNAMLVLATSQGGELSTEEVFDELLARHQKTESYFAVYEGEAPGGKTITAAISYHGPSQMASVHTQFFLDGEIVAAPLQATTPELGIVISGQNALHLKDASPILEQLTKVAVLLLPDKKRPLGTWTPALSMTKETMAAQLSISYHPQMPWVRDRLPLESTHEAVGNLTVFTTPEGCVSKVQSTTGILESQNFPNDEGDRTLVLKELQTGLSADEIAAFIKGYVPADLDVQSMRDHPLLAYIQRQMLVKFVAFVDNSDLTSTEVSTLLQKIKPLFKDYLNTIYPPDFWLQPDGRTACHEERMKELREVAESQWKNNGLQLEGLHPQTQGGEMAAKILTSGLKREFLIFLDNKAKASN